MEHRCSVRKQIEFQLLLYKQGLPVQNAVSGNLGLGGMFIFSGARMWQNNEFLEVEILRRSGKPGMRLPAVVVHHSTRGIGVVFDAVSGEQRRTLRAWLHDSNPEIVQESHSRAVA